MVTSSKKDWQKVIDDADSAINMDAEIIKQENITEKIVEPVEALTAINAVEEELKKEILLAKANLLNERKRHLRALEDAHKFAVNNIIADMLAVADSLEQALASIPIGDNYTQTKEGVDLTLKLFINILGNYAVAQINPVGENFDPTKHEAIALVDDHNFEAGAVVNVFQKGYSLHGRTIRPARVTVAKKK